MRRREFIAGVAGVWACPVAAPAQPATPVIGYLATTARDAIPFQTMSFRRGLAEGGFTEGTNVVIEYRWGDDKPERLPTLAADLVARRVDVIVAFSTAATRAAKVATGSIPIVFLTGDDPVTAGVVARISRPSANLTGVTFSSSTLGAKRLELLRGPIPKSDQIALLTDPNSSESVTQSSDAQKAAQTLGQSAYVLNISTNAEIETAFASLAHRRVDTFAVGGSPFFNARRDLLAALALRYAIPGMYPNRNFPVAGGLISYGASIPDAYRQVGIYVGRILKGAKPADLPVLQPTKFDLVINLRTAKVLKLAVPDRLLALADEVIE
jgi:putative tryptophan/tyrosine transport system substrate-binding protein